MGIFLVFRPYLIPETSITVREDNEREDKK
jgi:hypothetical protein